MINADKKKKIESTTRLGFIGAGNMATAIIEGLLQAGVCERAQISVSHPSAAKGAKKFARLGIEDETDDNRHVAEACDVLIFCVKPQVLERVCERLRDLLDVKRHLVISIAAGLNLEKLTQFLLGSSASLESKATIPTNT